jgi:hypothetical protein
VTLFLLFIFQVILLDEVGKFVYSMVIWSAIEVTARIQLLVIREDLRETALSALVAIVSVATLEALEFGLGQQSVTALVRF